MIHIDFETRSEVEIKTAGAYIYATHPSTELTCLCYAVDDGPVRGINWDEIQEMNRTGQWPINENSLLISIIHSGKTVKAFNAFFEQLIWEHIIAKKYKWWSPKGDNWKRIPNIPLTQWRCVMAKSLAAGLPQSLANAGDALKINVQKDLTGKRIMLKIAKPKTNWKETGDKWHENAADFQKLYDYCATDVEAERMIDKALPELNDFEQYVWFLDQTINRRGVRVDMNAIRKAKTFINIHSSDLYKEVFEISEGFVDKISRRAVVLEWLKNQNIPLEDLKKKTVSDKLKNPLPANVRRMLELRLELGKTSLAKYDAMLSCVSESDRIRDVFIYHGASTGRWTGKLVQIHNLPKGNVADTDRCVDDLLNFNLDTFEMFYPDVMGALSSCIRGMFIPKDGHDFVVADYAAIEARVVFWLANEIKGLEKFKNGEDLYVDMARVIYHKDSISKSERQLGKAAVLGCIAEGSMIYSDTGCIPIESIEEGQQIWDGEQWVNFRELVNVGLKNVIQIGELNLTLDHLILTNQGWQTAGEIALYGDIQHLKLGKYSDTGQLSGLNLNEVANVLSLSAVNANLKKSLEWIDFGWVNQLCAKGVLVVLPVNEEETPVSTLISFLILGLEEDGRFAGEIFNADVLTQIVPTSRGMALEAFPLASNPVEHSWNLLLNLMAGTNGVLPSIELIIPKGTQKEIYEWLLKPLTIPTKVKQCYDIVGCETNRFQCDKYIVHNCGYGMGHVKFRATCDQWGIPIDEQLAQRVVNAYREMYSTVVDFWYATEAAAKRALSHKETIIVGRVRWTSDGKNLYCTLPSGRVLTFNEAKLGPVQTSWGDTKEGITFWAIDGLSKRWTKTSTYGGKLVENITQAVARDILANAMLEAEAAGYPVAFSVHDEIVTEPKTGFGSIKEFETIISTTPKWAEGCPIHAEGWRGTRYKK